MNPSKIAGVFFILFLQFAAVFAAAPVVVYFKSQSVFPNEIQLYWKIIDDDGLRKTELYKDNSLIFDEKVSGTSNVNLFQVHNDGKVHTYKLIAYDQENLSVTAIKIRGNQTTPPVINVPSTVFSNKQVLRFTTNEPAQCRLGLTEAGMASISGTYETNHTTTLQIREGATNLYIKCIDEEDAETPKSVVVSFVYDITQPGTVSDITADVSQNKTILKWTAADDTSGIDHYNIYNSLKVVAASPSTEWTTTTDDDVYFITAVDKAGNEGSKQEFNAGRARLLASNYTAPIIEKKIDIAIPVVEANQTVQPSGISSTSKIAWSIFAILALFFIGWKIYEANSDRHGLVRYMRQRRKMRPIS